MRVETERDYLAALCPELDVIIADHNLPKFDAGRALLLMKQRGLTVPVIVVSETAGEELAVRMMQEGAADYLLKDHLDRLGMAVKQALERRRLEFSHGHTREVAPRSEQQAQSPLESAAERRRIERELLEISERERVRIGQDLHDGLGQDITSLVCLIESLGRKLHGRTAPEVDYLPRIQELLKNIVVQVRGLSRTLRPVTIERSGLTAALVELTTSVEHNTGVTCEFDSDGPVRIDAGTATHLYRIVQEALNTAVRHANAKNTNVMLKNIDGCIALTVRDDGIGIPDEADQAVGLGLRTMAYRARIIGADLDVNHGSEGGTVVKCVIAVDSSRGLIKRLGAWRPAAPGRDANPQKTGPMAEV